MTMLRYWSPLFFSMQNLIQRRRIGSSMNSEKEGEQRFRIFGPRLVTFFLFTNPFYSSCQHIRYAEEASSLLGSFK